MAWLSDNPVKSAHEIVATTNSYRLLGTVFAEYKLTKDLKFRSSWSTDYNNLIDNHYFSPITANASAVGGSATNTNFLQLTWLNENILTYTKQIGKAISAPSLVIPFSKPVLPPRR